MGINKNMWKLQTYTRGYYQNKWERITISQHSSEYPKILQKVPLRSLPTPKTVFVAIIHRHRNTRCRMTLASIVPRSWPSQLQENLWKSMNMVADLLLSRDTCVDVACQPWNVPHQPRWIRRFPLTLSGKSANTVAIEPQTLFQILHLLPATSIF